MSVFIMGFFACSAVGVSPEDESIVHVSSVCKQKGPIYRSLLFALNGFLLYSYEHDPLQLLHEDADGSIFMAEVTANPEY
jgi:hypothetical protein